MTWNQYTSICFKLAQHFGKHHYSKELVTDSFKYWKDREFRELIDLADKAIASNVILNLVQPVKQIKQPVVIFQKEKPIDTGYLERHLAINGVESVWDLIEKKKSSS